MLKIVCWGQVFRNITDLWFDPRCSVTSVRELKIRLGFLVPERAVQAHRVPYGNRLLTIKQAAEFVGVSVKSLRNYLGKMEPGSDPPRKRILADALENIRRRCPNGVTKRAIRQHHRLRKERLGIDRVRRGGRPTRSRG